MQTLPLTPEMQRCLASMRTWGGEIHRYPGGFWSHANWATAPRLVDSYGEATVAALVRRGWATYTQTRPGRHSGVDFPIRAQLTATPPQSELDLSEVAALDTKPGKPLESAFATG